MSPAEKRFKAMIHELVNQGIYPAPAACGIALGRKFPLRSLGGRETRWRRQVLNDLGWAERSWPHRARRSWVKP